MPGSASDLALTLDVLDDRQSGQQQLRVRRDLDVMGDSVVTISVTLDDANDPDMLADVIAFLDGFEETGDGETQVENRLGPTSSPLRALPTAKRGNAPRGRETDPHRTRASAENRTRVERYWKKKDELRMLRKQVAYLTSTLELLRRRRGLSLEVKSASGLRVTLGRAFKPRVARVGWKQSAAQERELRALAERANAQLRSLIRTHMRWGSGFGRQLQVAWATATDGCRTVPMQKSNSGATQEGHDERWSAILQQLGQDAAALRMTDSFGAIELPKSSSDQNLPGPTMEWTSSFFIPVESPQRIGQMWWEVSRKLFLASENGVDSVLSHQEGAGSRLEKRVSWSVVNESNQEVRLSTVAMFELTETHSHWIVAVSSKVFDAARSEVLFRTTALKVVTQVRSSPSNSCVFRSRYRIHDVDSAPAASASREKMLRRLGTKELAMNVWVDKMRKMEQDMGRILMEQLV